MIVAFSGIRDLAVSSWPFVEGAVTEALKLKGLEALRFGGARGADHVALRAASRQRAVTGRPWLAVYVPFTIGEQPTSVRADLRVLPDEVIELDLPREKSSYLQRNALMIAGADLLVAFTDGRESGGTWHSIKFARKEKIPVQIVTVRRA